MRQPATQGLNRQRAFSLLELILVVVLLGVLAGGAGLLITTPIQAYNDQLRRQQLVDQAEMALRQIARDVRRALPNSIRISGGALEMVNTIDGARYRDENQSGLGTDIDILEFAGGDTEFNFLGPLNFLTLGAIPSDQRLVIYNTAPTNIYTDAANNLNTGIITSTATGLTLSDSTTYADEHHITMANPFRFTQQSPGQRAFFVDGPISYICNPGTNSITRYDNYAYRTAQLASDAAMAALGGVQSGLVVTKLSVCNIDYQAGTPQRGGIITLQITLSDAGENVTLLHQVHVDNVP